MQSRLGWWGAGLLALAMGTCPSLAAGEPDGLLGELHSAALENRHRLDFDGEAFSGPAWRSLLEEGGRAQFFVIGEEHGIAENPKFAAALFAKLSADGYSKVVIEVSPPMASELDRALEQGGLHGLMDLYRQPGAEPAFFGMREEAEFLADVRARAPVGEPVLWGVDYEVGGDRHLIRMLEGIDKPEPASAALAALKAASEASWARYSETGEPRYIFSFSGDPALVREVRETWPGVSPEADWILETLEETLEINRLWVGGQAWRSNARRVQFLRHNFLRHWRDAHRQGPAPKVLVKLGASHAVRGRSMVEVFDLGTLLPELAVIEGSGSFSVLVLPGAGTEVARFDPANWAYVAGPAPDSYGEGFDAITRAAFDDAFTLIDLRPLRSVVGMRSAAPELLRLLHGFDSVLVLTGSAPAAGIELDSM